MANEAHKTFQIAGRVIDQTLQRVAVRLRIEAWDKDLIVDDLVGSAVTDERGAFRITFDRSYFAELFFDRQPDLFFKVFQDDVLIRSTEDDVLWNIAASEIEVAIEVDLPQSEELEPDGSEPITDTTPEPRHSRELPVTPIAPGVIRLSPDSINDAATTAMVDAKLNAALKELIKDLIGSTSPVVEDFIDRLPLDYHLLLAETVLSVIKKIVAPLMLRDPALADLAAHLKERDEAEDAATLMDLLQPNVLLAEHPLFVADVRQGKGRELLRIANLSQSLIDKIDAGEKQLEAWNDLDWDQAVTENVITPAQRDELFFTTELSRLTGEQYGLVEAARQAELHTTADLIKWDQTHWLDLITKTPDSIPVGLTPEAYAASLAKSVQQTFPSEYFCYRIANKAVAHTLPRVLEQTTVLLAHNSDLLLRLDHADLDWTGIEAAQQPALAAHVREVAGLVGTYRHLGVAEVLADGATTPAQKSHEIGRRIDTLGVFLQNNSAEDLRYLNLLDASSSVDERTGRESEIDWTGIAPADQTPVRNQLLAYQRVLHLAPDHDTATTLLRAGLDSSSAIANQSYSAFLQLTGLNEASAAPIHRAGRSNAARIANHVQLHWDSIAGLEQGRYFQGIDPKFVNDLKELPGYQELFGNTSYCVCEHCRSIFSPAAYFTDLMYFIEKNITNPAFGGKIKHPLRLRLRRPDLWRLSLTCQNTDTLIPHLTLVIEVLESYLKRTLSTQNVVETLANDRSAIGLPYHVPLATVREYLRDWDTELVQLYELLNAPLDTLYKETLRLSDGEWTALVTAAPLDIAWIKFPSPGTQMDAVDFLRFTGLTRNGLDELRSTETAGGFGIARVEVGKDIQSEKEVVIGLSDALLDRIGRFLRLARSSNYTLTELDELLQTQRIADAQPFSQKALTGLARFKRLAQSLGLPVDALIGVLDHIPTRPLKAGAQSLAAELNLTALTGAGEFPITFHHAHFNTSQPKDETVDPRLPALLGIVGLVESDLLALCAQYPAAFPFHPNGKCDLTADNVALLYAHSTLARVWRITPAELSLVMNKLNLPANVPTDFRSLDRLELLLDSVTQLKALPLSITDAFSLIDPTTSLVTVDEVVAVVNDLQSSGALSFGPSVLTSLPGIEPEDATDILALLVDKKLLEKDGDKYRLAAAYAPDTKLSEIFSQSTKVAALLSDVHDALLTFHFLNLLPNALAATAGMDVDKTLVAFAFAQPGWDNADMLKALATKIVDGVATDRSDLKPLLTLAGDLARLGELFSRLRLQTADCWFIAQYPSIFGIENIRALRIPELAAMHRYRELGSALTSAETKNLIWQYQVRANGNTTIAPTALFGDAAALAPVFKQALHSSAHGAFTIAAAPSFSPEQLVTSPPLNAGEIALLADRKNLDATLLRSVFFSQVLPATALSGIERAIQLYSFCQLLSIQGPSLGKLSGLLLLRDFASLSKGADFLLSILQARYPDQAARDKNVLPRTEALNVLRRDALCDYIIARADLFNFKNREDLYAYFLIDVEMGGCFETSRLVAAMSSLQLYVHRCLIDLEQSPDGFSVLSLIDADDIRREWEWRRNYRVWEANRKVFLYPENYLEPELRDDKTPLFKELEDDLLQRKITLEAAAEAYHQYLTGFSTLARLKVVGVCYDSGSRSYWFVARTHSDPYQYYLRHYQLKGNRWHPWEAIDLGIGAPYVSPLVHLGRLYLFWIEITSMDKSSFVKGDSIFLGIEHRMTVHYSYRQSNGKWAADQKLILPEKLFDRRVIDLMPVVIENILGFTFVAMDQAGTEELVKYYRKSRTYAKVIALKSEDPEKIEIHYFRKFKRSHVLISLKVSHPTVKNPANTDIISWPVSQAEVDGRYLDLKGGKLEIVKPNPSPGSEYVLATLNLLLNDLSVVKTPFRFEENTEHTYFNGSKGTEAVGILFNAKLHTFNLMLRANAGPGAPSATDDMLGTHTQRGGHVLTKSISTDNAHDMIPVNGKPSETVLTHGLHQHWIWRRRDVLQPRRLAVRINTTLDSYLTQVLFNGGIDKFLTLATQTSQGEALPSLHSTDPVELGFKIEPADVLPFSGSFGAYYRELFFHIPFLIANQLNSEGKYADAKYWYEKIFNPGAPASPGDPKVKHRVWQYREFRNVGVPKLKELLNDEAAIDQYQDDPFDPHAIARLRLSAYQKSIVMKYIDNLIDWGDDLFTQETMESINEATMLYVLAADILGPRPVSVGPCKSVDENTITYEVLGPAIDKGSEFLMCLENVHLQVGLEAIVRQTFPGTGERAVASDKASAPAAIRTTQRMTAAVEKRIVNREVGAPNTMSATLLNTGLGSLGQYAAAPRVPLYTAPALAQNDGPVNAAPGNREQDAQSDSSRFTRSNFMPQNLPAFCIPPNEILLGYWDRIEDRLFKIRHCLNIHGERITLALFQPPIDPMLLVRAKAAGLSIEDIIGQQNEALPPYRFSFLVEKARQYAGTVQSFGGALLSALEKKDGEELSLLRSTHEQNILKLQRSVRKQQISEAQAQLAALQSQQRNVQNKIDHYNEVIQSSLNGWETNEQGWKHGATRLRTAEALLHIQAGIDFLLPQLGSPFAMKYGGDEIGKSVASYAQWYASLAQFADSAAGSAGLEAGFQRRSEDWRLQLKLATEEMNQLSKQILASEIRLRIAEKDLEIHSRQLDQAQEVHDFLKSKFTSVGLYTFLSAQLMRLYRSAYQMTAQVARQAERAFQFERDSTEVFIQSDNWQSDKSGLLAGERLLLQLNRMEKAYLETNTRDIEVSQSFSLGQIDPVSLQNLKQTGKCNFVLDEVWFDLQYPGQYRRLLKSVRLTIPCVVGPYTNVAATLRLEHSDVRRDPQAGDSALQPVPPTMTRTIATSHAQNDAGVFDLNFRDERYLPFEGAGAVNSEWSLDLPQTFRMFDYGSLSDVIIHLSYVARYDGVLGKHVEDEDNLVSRLNALPKGLARLVSLRHEFPDAFHQLLNPPAGQEPKTSFALESKHFPFWLGDRELKISDPVEIWLSAVKGQAIAADAATLDAWKLKVAGVSVRNWSLEKEGDGKGFVNVSTIAFPSPIRWTIEAGQNAFNNNKLKDLLLVVKYAIIKPAIHK